MAEKKAAEQGPAYTLSGTHVFVHNPETGGDWECPADYLEIALARGWELSEAPAEEPFDKPAKKAASKKSESAG